MPERVVVDAVLGQVLERGDGLRVALRVERDLERAAARVDDRRQPLRRRLLGRRLELDPLGAAALDLLARVVGRPVVAAAAVVIVPAGGESEQRNEEQGCRGAGRARGAEGYPAACEDGRVSTPEPAWPAHADAHPRDRARAEQHGRAGALALAAPEGPMRRFFDGPRAGWDERTGSGLGRAPGRRWPPGSCTSPRPRAGARPRHRHRRGGAARRA